MCLCKHVVRFMMINLLCKISTWLKNFNHTKICDNTNASAGKLVAALVHPLQQCLWYWRANKISYSQAEHLGREQKYMLSEVFSTLYCWNIPLKFKQLVAWESNYFTSNIKFIRNQIDFLLHSTHSNTIYIYILKSTFQKYMCTNCHEMC